MDLNALTARIDREHDSCGIFARMEKSGVPTRKTVETGISALNALRHRAGYVQGEGDGCGVLMDIPRTLWERFLMENGVAANLAHDERFAVGHFFLERATADHLRPALEQYFADHGLTVLATRFDVGNQAALGPTASRENPVFVQVAAMLDSAQSEGNLYNVSTGLEQIAGIHAVSLSRSTVVYKVVGDSDTLIQYYPDLADPACHSAFVISHTRYSTNTATASSRVQPFGMLGHNGEINTIARFYAEASMLGLWVDPNFSDSQMVDSVVHGLTEEKGWSLFEAAEMLFPPIVNEIKQMQPALSDMYMFLRALWGPFSQGPAAMMMRKDNEAVFTVDALGLRPLWLVETDDAYSFCSEQGIVPPSTWVADPKALSPGEKVGATWTSEGVKLFSYTEMQQIVLERMKKRYKFTGEGRNIRFANAFLEREEAAHPFWDQTPFAVRAVAFGWRDEDVKMLEFEIQTSAEPIRSLGYDGPLPVLDGSGLPALSDFLQETVAVVTNPAIDREREIEHFSTRIVLGKRPSLDGLYQSPERVELQSPLLLEAHPGDAEVRVEDLRAVAHRHGALCYEDALAALHTGPYGTVEILIHREAGEDTRAAVSRFERRAVEAVNAGANVIVLDDRLQFLRGGHIDPFLAIAAVHKALCRPASSQGGEHLRRRTSLLLRSGGLRNLHDIVVAIGLGADAVDPYLMWEFVSSKGTAQAVENLYVSLCKGMEKVVSTIGIHELRGYERLFGAIGLSTEVAGVLGVPNFCGSDQVGYGMGDLDTSAMARQALYDGKDERKLRMQKPFQIYPRIWKAAGLVAQGTTPYGPYFERVDAFEHENPVSLRHALQFKLGDGNGVYELNPADRDKVDTSVDGHSYPFVISSMSFGSQGEIAYRSYAEAAYRMNIVGLNGEGGEIKDLLSKYPRNRGRQVASGRFGVNAELCNGAYMLEIKIGQGAKPGEGGHLPGSKVTVQVANARNASPGVDLISPSNNHDIYSIEDLAQVIYELREVNPTAKIAVKVPVVPNIGTIAVGIAKAGADIITLSGFDGGTGAARAHALRHVGLPVDIGVRLAHDGLCESGLRNVVELWADGGMKTAADVMKAILLGANRVGFGTLAMVAMGCTACRACHKDTCHVGIATQMTDMEEAIEKGVASFAPREFEHAVEHLTRFFTTIGEHVRALTAALGASRTQDLVGRRDLLTQVSLEDRVDLSWLLEMKHEHAGVGSNIVFREWPVEHEALSVAVESRTNALRLAVGQGEAMTTGANLRVIEGKQDTQPDHESVKQLPRALGTRVSGEAVRQGRMGESRIMEVPNVGGNGFAAYHQDGMVSVAHGGAQDGVGKSAIGGRIVVLKHRGRDGQWHGGSVGKGLAYGAQRGQFIVQGGADARAGIRLSGADIVIGAELTRPIHDELGWIGERSSIKGFAFEYMTAGRAVVLGDPGPWICSGMTGGTVYLRHQPDMGLTETALRKRVAKGAKVAIRSLDDEGKQDVVDLLTSYQRELRRSGQTATADRLNALIANPSEHFLMVRPGGDITDQSIATE